MDTSAFNDEPNNDAEIDLVGGFIQELRDWCDIWDDIDVPGQMRTAAHISEMINELKTVGWTVYGSRMKGKKKIAGAESEWIWYAIAVMRGEPEEVVFVDSRILVLKPGKCK